MHLDSMCHVDVITWKCFQHYCPVRADSRLAPSQWETSLQSNAVSHWLGANLESALPLHKKFAVFCQLGYAVEQVVELSVIWDATALTGPIKFYIMTSSNGNIFRVTGSLWEESTGGFPSKSPVTWSFDVFLDLCPNKRLSKQSRRRWFETPSRSLWRYCNAQQYQSEDVMNGEAMASMDRVIIDLD